MIQTLWCDLFNSAAVDWTEFGNTPYLQDTDTDYVYTATRLLVEGRFYFQDADTSEILDSILLYFETQQDAGGDDKISVSIESTVKPTLTWVVIPNAGSYTYQTYDLVGTYTDWTGVNGINLTLTSQRTGGTMSTVYARRAYLYITSHPAATTVTMKRTLDKTTRHNQRSGTIQYIRMPTAPY